MVAGLLPLKLAAAREELPTGAAHGMDPRHTVGGALSDANRPLGGGRQRGDARRAPETILANWAARLVADVRSFLSWAW